MCRSLALALTAALPLVGACAGAPDRAPAPTPPRYVVEPRPHGDAVTMQVLCEPGGAERCNGLDDDCDGAIDEACPSGAPDGLLHLTLAWAGPASLGIELETAVVTDPADGTRPPDATGPPPVEPRLVDAAPGCPAEGEPLRPVRVSSVWFDQAATPVGTWRVYVRHRAACAEPQEPVPFTVAVAGPAQVAGVWNAVAAPGERVEVVSFILR